MPKYLYQCESCGGYEDVVMTYKEFDDLETIKHECGGDMFVSFDEADVPVHYKSAGFFITDERGLTGHKRKPNIKVGSTADLSEEMGSK